jgi:hypothetical protein
LAALIENDLDLLLQRHASEERVQRPTARNAIVVVVATAIRARNEMLDTCVGLRQGFLAEKA